jgi:hypothetical protein
MNPNPPTINELKEFLTALQDLGAGKPVEFTFTKQANGFKCVTLGPSNRNSSQIRLHLWPSDVGDGDVHDHSWHFASLCICGSIKQEIYEVAPAGKRFCHYDCRSTGTSKTGKKLELNYVAEQSLKLGSAKVYRSGEHYFLPAHILHRSRVGEGEKDPTITIIRHGPYLRNTTNVFIPFSDHSNCPSTILRANENLSYNHSDEIEFCVEKLRSYICNFNFQRA